MSTDEISANDEKYHSLENFVKLHASQFDNMKLPAFLRKITHKKIYAPKFINQEDIFELTPSSVGGYLVKPTTNVRRWADVWVVPHILSGTAEEFYKQIKDDKELLERLWAMMDLDKLIVPDEETPKKEAPAAAPAPAAIPAGAQPTVKHDADPFMIEVVMEEAEVTRERAIAALENTGNDLIASITECTMHPELQAANDEMNKRLFVQYGNLDEVEDKKKTETATVEEIVETEAAPADGKKAPETEEEKHLQRVNTAFKALFQLNYVGMYMTMRPRGPDSPFSGPPHPEEIIKTYYVPHELGASVGFSNEPNCKMAHFVGITTGNMGWTLLWADKNIEAGEALTRAPITPIPCPFNV
jgi:chemotaxis protein histidine kinase CheA